MADRDSVDFLLERAQAERDAQSRLYEGVETKAGVVLGFAGVLVAVGPKRSGLALAATVLAAVAALAGLGTFLPDRHFDLNLREIRDRYASAALPFTRVALLNAQVRAWERVSSAMAGKNGRLRIGIASLAISVVILSIDRLIR